ncbi:NADPH-dependent oxidoreductase, partial [Pseudomonas sp. RTC3]|nr:NADPH-dependent oxidoreductase [Pseudomonas sp. RTC3]MEB0243755.1 NADPH-dependent oxidoreductase [Pseudomonas sp. 5C2]
QLSLAPPIYRFDKSAQATTSLTPGAYSATADVEAVAEYDERLGAFYQREGMKSSGWSEQVINRLQSVSNLHGREELVEELKRMGFGLR